MNTFDALRLRRSIRKFRPEPVSPALLREIVEVSRLYPSGGNLQPIRFAVITDRALTDALFPTLRWAMYLPDYKIAESERPTAYVILLRDEKIRKNCDYDVGAASTTVMLAAVEKGLATCPIGNPAQESTVVPMADTVRYTQDETGAFLVPKWNTEDVLVFDK